MASIIAVITQLIFPLLHFLNGGGFNVSE